VERREVLGRLESEREVRLSSSFFPVQRVFLFLLAE
jgi:hypothetical protein